jgi:hypothetical protein
MFCHSGETDAKGFCQFHHGRFAAGQSGKNPASYGMSESAECFIQLGFIVFNHMVK